MYQCPSGDKTLKRRTWGGIACYGRDAIKYYRRYEYKRKGRLTISSTHGKSAINAYKKIAGIVMMPN